jgi:hypothetical protein
MDKHFQLSLPGSRPWLDGSEVRAPAQFYERSILGGQVYGLWIGGQRIYDVTIYDAADRHVGTIGPASPRVAEDYNALQRMLVAEALLAGPIPPALVAQPVS